MPVSRKQSMSLKQHFAVSNVLWVPCPTDGSLLSVASMSIGIAAFLASEIDIRRTQYSSLVFQKLGLVSENDQVKYAATKAAFAHILIEQKSNNWWKILRSLFPFCTTKMAATSWRTWFTIQLLFEFHYTLRCGGQKHKKTDLELDLDLVYLHVLLTSSG